MKTAAALVLSLAALAAGLAAAGPRPGGAAFPGTNGQIAFVSNRDGNDEIYLMNADGGDQTNLSSHPAFDGAHAWSPDGTRIAFVSNRDGNEEIYVMNADGSGLTRLTNNHILDDAPAWSPDGTRIAFMRAPYSNLDLAEIYVMNADGSGVTQLTSNGAFDNAPSWSPDDSKVLFHSTRDGNFEVYVMNADGSGQTNLSNSPASDLNAAWSPDGTRIAFQSDRDDPDFPACRRCNIEIYVVNADGSGLRRLTQHPAEDSAAVWSPDGSKIAFVSLRDDNFEVYVMNADGSGQTNLSNHPASDFAPDWQPLPGVALVAGWNAVLYGGAALPVEQALGNCLASVEAVFVWDTAQAWRWWLKGAPSSGNTLTGLRSGAILWLRAAAACTWLQA